MSGTTTTEQNPPQTNGEQAEAAETKPVSAEMKVTCRQCWSRDGLTVLHYEKDGATKLLIGQTGGRLLVKYRLTWTDHLKADGLFILSLIVNILPNPQDSRSLPTAAVRTQYVLLLLAPAPTGILQHVALGLCMPTPWFVRITIHPSPPT